MYTFEEEKNEISISLKGTGDGAKQRDVAFTYYKEKSNYFYFSTEVQITNFSIESTYENRVGIFLGDGSKMGTIGYYFKKYTSSTNLMIGRKYIYIIPRDNLIPYEIIRSRHYRKIEKK